MTIWKEEALVQSRLSHLSCQCLMKKRLTFQLRHYVIMIPSFDPLYVCIASLLQALIDRST